VSYKLAPFFVLAALSILIFGNLVEQTAIFCGGTLIILPVMLNGSLFHTIGAIGAVFCASMAYLMLSHKTKNTEPKRSFSQKIALRKKENREAAAQSNIELGNMVVSQSKMEETERKLKSMSESFESLSEIFFNLSDKLRRPAMLDLRKICNEAFEYRCQGCPKTDVCLGLEYGTTLEVMNRLTSKLHTRGRVEEDDVPNYLRSRCEHIPSIIEAINAECARLTEEALRSERNEIFALVNIVNALLAIKELCFDQKKYTLKEFLEAVRNNWEGNEEMRIDATRCHGWGDGHKDSTELCARINNDMDKMVQNITGTYGGKIVLAHLAYTEVRWWGEATRATPDGRKSGDYLAQGLTPSRLTKIPHVTSVVNSLAGLDGSLFGGSSVVNIILPSAKMTLESCEAFLRAAAKSAMQSLQLNCTSKEQLLDAQKHPEKYPDLIVRVTGFSAKFTALSKEWQDEVISRNFYE
jgi:hypothetical protein